MLNEQRGWKAKFRDAFRGIGQACRGEKSFVVHFSAAILVVTAAALLKVTTTEWCLLILCIAIVFSAETFNSSIESLARAVTEEQNAHVGRSLDTAAGAVLIAAMGAAVVGVVVFLPYV